MEPTRQTRPLLLAFNARAPLEDVLEAVKAVYVSTGCNPCGRLSLFLKADEPDPVIESLKQIGSLESVHELGQQVGIRS
jgi:hypothetical protein